MREYKHVGELLIESGLVTPDQLEHALQLKQDKRIRVGEALIELGYTTEARITECLAQQYGYDVVDPRKLRPEAAALEIVEPMTALSQLVLPWQIREGHVYCVIADPLDIPTTDAIVRASKGQVVFSLATPSELFEAVAKAYGIGPKRMSTPAASEEEKPQPKRAKSAAPRAKRHIKVKPQTDRAALLDALDATLSARDGGKA